MDHCKPLELEGTNANSSINMDRIFTGSSCRNGVYCFHSCMDSSTLKFTYGNKFLLVLHEFLSKPVLSERKINTKVNVSDNCAEQYLPSCGSCKHNTNELNFACRQINVSICRFILAVGNVI